MLKPSSIRRIFSSRVPNKDSMPRLIWTTDFIRGGTFWDGTSSGPGGQTSAGAEAGTTSTYKDIRTPISHGERLTVPMLAQCGPEIALEKATPRRGTCREPGRSPDTGGPRPAAKDTCDPVPARPG